MRDALVGRVGSDERDVRQAVLVARLGEIGPLLGGQIDYYESVGAVLLGLLAKVVDPELIERVVVPHENDGYGKALGPRGLDHLETLDDVRRPGLDGHLIRLLDGRAIGLGVRVGDAKFDDGRSALLHA